MKVLLTTYFVNLMNNRQMLYNNLTTVLDEHRV